MEVVLVSLHVAKLRERLVAIIQDADVWLKTLVGLQMGTQVSTLGELAITLVTGERAFASVTTSVSLQVAQLGESKFAARKVTRVWLLATVRSAMDVEMSFFE
jgi:hypothetical protein